MPIEFRCSNCGKMLRVPDDAAGRQARCPACNTVLNVPAAASSGAMPPPVPPQSASPFAAGGMGPNPYSSPQTAAGPTPSYAAASGEPVSFGHVVSVDYVFGSAWRVFWSRWGQCVVATLLFVLVLGLFQGVAAGMQVAAGRDAGARASIAVLVNVAGLFLNSWLNAGLIRFFLKIARGQEAALEDIFSGGPYVLPVAGASILFGLMVGLGCVLCLVPGMILGLMFWQFAYWIVDRGTPVMEAFEMSRKAMAGNKATALLLWLALGFGGIVFVALTCGLGVLLFTPFAGIVNAMLYLLTTGQSTTEQPAAAAAGNPLR